MNEVPTSLSLVPQYVRLYNRFSTNLGAFQAAADSQYFHRRRPHLRLIARGCRSVMFRDPHRTNRLSVARI
ncbi:unnamed protein product, partial [Nesidiocoris tenuis]